LFALTKASPVDRHDLTLIIATDAARRSDPLIKKDSALQAGSVATATSLAAHCAERGEGCAIIILGCPENLAPPGALCNPLEAA
jgi:hypothetical protein